MIDNWNLLEVEGEKYVPVLATKRRASNAKKESKRNLLENKEGVRKVKSNKNRKLDDNTTSDVGEKNTDAPKSLKKTKKVKTDQDPTSGQKEPKDRKEKKPKTQKKNTGDGTEENVSLKPEEQTDAREVKKSTKTVELEQKDDSKVDAEPTVDNRSAQASTEIKSEAKMLSVSTSTKSTRMRIVSEAVNYGTIEKKQPETEVKVDSDSKATETPSIMLEDKKIDSDSTSNTQTPVPTPRTEDLSVSEDSEIDSSDSEASSTSEESIEPVSTPSVPRIELDAATDTTPSKDESQKSDKTNDKDSSDDSLEQPTSPRLSIAKRPKATKNNRPTSARVSIPPGAIPPTDPESKSKVPSIGT